MRSALERFEAWRRAVKDGTAPPACGPGRRRARRVALYFDKERHTANIEANRTALRRLDAKLEDWCRRWPAGACCPACYWGAPFGVVEEKAARCAQMLAVYLRKRGRPEDLAEALNLQSDWGWSWYVPAYRRNKATG